MYCPSKSFSLQLELILSQMSIKVTIVLYLVSHIFLLYLNFYKKKVEFITTRIFTIIFCNQDIKFMCLIQQ